MLNSFQHLYSEIPKRVRNDNLIAFLRELKSSATASFIVFYLIPSLIFFSAIFWMRNSVDYAGWSIVEVCGILLLIRLVLKNDIRQEIAGDIGIVLPSQKIFVPLLLLTFYSASSILWSCNLHATLTGLYKIVFILVMLINFLNEPERWRKALKFSAIAISGAAASFMFGGTEKWQMSYPNLLGGFLSLGGVLSVGACLTSNGLMRLWNLLFSILIAFSLFFTVSLGPILSWLAGLTLQIFVYDRKKIWVSGCLFLVLVGATFTNHIPGIQDKINPFKGLFQRKLSDPFATERIQLWKDSANYFYRYPLIGTGLGTFRDVYPQFKEIPGVRNSPYAHNEVLNFLCELGLIGGLLFACCIWNLLTSIWKDEERRKEWGIWFAVAFSAAVHSLVDFNLHYPPVLLLFVFSVSLVMPTRRNSAERARSEKAIRTGAIPARRLLTLFSLLALGILFSLPGIAELIFRKNYNHGGTSAPEKINLRQQAALAAIRLDPFNGFYHFETGRMRNVLISIDLEPRNVWRRRAAAQFFIQEWEKSGKESDLESAFDQYSQIIKFAPNVAQFRLEAENLQLRAARK